MNIRRILAATLLALALIALPTLYAGSLSAAAAHSLAKGGPGTIGG